MKKVATNEASRPRPRRILLLIDGLEGDGAERQLCELAKGLQRRTDFEPHVGVLEANETGHAWMLEELGIVVNLFERRSRFDLSPLKRIVAYIRDHDIELVHGYLSMGSEFGLLAAKWCRIPAITSSIRNGMNRDWRERVRTTYQSYLADFSVANSNAGFRSRFRRRRDSFRVIYNGFDLERFSISEADRAAVRAELDLTGEARPICMAARMEPEKDHRTLLDAMRLLQSKHPDAVLLLAGQGRLRSLLEAHARECRLENRVRFLGHRRDVERIMSICEASVLLTNTEIHLEGVSNTIIESMALGTPVLATRGGGTDEVLGEEDAGRPPYVHGIKVEPFEPAQVAEGLGYYLDHDTERRQIGAAARKMVVERFNLSRFIADNVALYRELERKGVEGPTTSAEQSPGGDPPVSQRP